MEMKFDICGFMHTCVRGNACMYPPPQETHMHVNAHLNTRFAVLLNAIKICMHMNAWRGLSG